MKSEAESVREAADMLDKALADIRAGRDPIIYSAIHYRLEGTAYGKFLQAETSVRNCIGARNRVNARKVQFAIEDISKFRDAPGFDAMMRELGKQ